MRLNGAPLAALDGAPLAVLNGARIDGGWYEAVTGFARDTRWLNTPLEDWSTYGAAFFGLLFLLAWWRARHRPAAAMAGVLAAALAVLLAYALNSVVKELFKEPRPCRALPHPYLVEACPAPNDYAFPSNHAVFGFAAAAGLLLADRLLGWLALAGAVLLGFARVYVGAHYPHDVFAGAVLGALVAVVVVPVGRRVGDAGVARLRAGPLRVLVGPGVG
ncbi:phosphatase PAP2 family protein [Kitasatospora sp. LaBMicrA B282]|uniref:phosphatase PAP2 family protein n=1 Tax=Kitasatospora sp. LaBMicrA B282 TaxID=3420949 RepID=UPI003D0ACB0B